MYLLHKKKNIVFPAKAGQFFGKGRREKMKKKKILPEKRLEKKREGLHIFAENGKNDGFSTFVLKQGWE